MGRSVFGTGIARICAVVATARAREFCVLVERALKETPTVELRLDWLASDGQRRKALDWLRRFKPDKAVFVATCRRRVGGGELAGGPAEELFWLRKAKEAGCAWCDLEVETVKELHAKFLEGYALPPKVMISIHDFRGTRKLSQGLNVPTVGGVAAVKLAAMSRKLSDSARLLRETRGRKHIVAVPMGEIGLPARILSLREGSALVYAPVAAQTAPGQVPIHDLKELYRAHRLTRKTSVFGVIGDPISHSLSPLLHNTGYVAAKKDAVFLPFLVEDLGEFLKVLGDFGLKGFGVTLPHKRSILKYLAECEPLAAEIGAVNTVSVRRNGKMTGYNTDYVGVLRALEGKLRLSGSRVVILGAGGAARAAAFAAAKAGAEVLLCARRESAARELARAVHGGVLRRAALRKHKCDVLVNATPVGMHPHPASSPLEADELKCTLVFDLIYRPLQTKLLRMAAARGIRTVSGVEMFLEQGMAQWELWMGSRAPESAMRNAVVNALKGKQTARQ